MKQMTQLLWHQRKCPKHRWKWGWTSLSNVLLLAWQWGFSICFGLFCSNAKDSDSIKFISSENTGDDRENSISNEVTETMQCMKSWTPRSQQDLYNSCDEHATKHPIRIPSFWLRSFPLKNFVSNMIRQININETRQHLGIQTLSTVVMWYPHQKNTLFYEASWFSVVPGSRLANLNVKRFSTWNWPWETGVVTFSLLHCFIRWHLFVLFCFALLVLSCVLFFVLFSLFCFPCSFSGSLQWTIFIACCKTSLTTPPRFILLYLPWWGFNPIFGKKKLGKGAPFHVRLTSLFQVICFSNYSFEPQKKTKWLTFLENSGCWTGIL